MGSRLSLILACLVISGCAPLFGLSQSFTQLLTPRGINLLHVSGPTFLLSDNRAVTVTTNHDPAGVYVVVPSSNVVLQMIPQYRWATDPVTAALSEDGTMLATVFWPNSDYATLQIYDTTHFGLKREVTDIPRGFTSDAFPPVFLSTGQLIVGQVLIDLNGGSATALLDNQDGFVVGKIEKEGVTLLVLQAGSGSESIVRVVNMSDGKELFTAPGRFVATSDQGLLACDQGGQLVVLNVSNGNLDFTVPGLQNPEGVFSKTGLLAVTGEPLSNEMRYVDVYDDTGKRIAHISSGNSGFPIPSSFSSNGRLLATFTAVINLDDWVK